MTTSPTPEVAARVRALKAEPASAYDDPDFQRAASSPIAPQRAVADLQAAAGPGAIFVSDIGEHMLFALHYLTARSADRFTIHLGLGSMASGIASAVGLALGDRTRRVICICGDGGMQMAGMELLVAVKLRLPIVFAVFNDARYNMVYHGYRYTFGREAAWETPVIDFALLDGGQQHADGPEAQLLPGPHGGLHVVGDLGLEGHARSRARGRGDAPQ